MESPGQHIAVSDVMFSSEHIETLTGGTLELPFQPPLDWGWSRRGLGRGVFYESNKTELTPDKDFVWG